MSANSYKNDIYESSSPTLSLKDDQCSLIDEGFWHDNDLVLAAELGKALLDRNRKLELALEKSKSIEREKNAEIEFLIKELTNLRELSQRKMAFVDEADRYNQELDNSNRQLMRKISEDQQKIQRLSNTIASLEDQVAGLVERLKKCDSQSMNGEKESPHSPHHRRFVRNSPLSTSTSSAAVSPRKISGTVNANTKDTLSRNSNTFAIRNWSKSPYLNKDRGISDTKQNEAYLCYEQKIFKSAQYINKRMSGERWSLFY
ncbi:unnamed protein product [Heterobilharzia americana]|nr:unnamed protein product [Heterobilharzia americana]